jgi:acetylornithine deacetylase/succinyl-diaminopimelate desuccinylase-like protein/predicted double-glycine peptidase
MNKHWALAALLLARPAAAGPTDFSPLYRDARGMLDALVRLDTTNPPGNEILAARYLKDRLDPAGIASEIYTSTGTRSSLIARLKGSGSKKPLLLMCHTDVVPANKSDWGTDPFVPTEKDGYLYGRGTIDVKSMCASEAAILLWIARRHIPLSRDVVFFAEADEESGGDDRHIDWLMKNHADVLDAEFGINEGGNPVLEGGRMSEIRVQAAEKEYVDVTIKAEGSAGHASIPRPDNAVARTARAAAKLSDFHPPAELNGVVRGFLEAKSKTATGELQAAIKDVLAASPGPALDAAADRLAAADPQIGAMLRDTLVPTILRGGYKGNVIPASAEAVFNARLLPGRKPEEFAATLRSLVAADSVTLSYETSGPVAGPSFLDTELFRAIISASKEQQPQAPVVPYMSPWSTDSQELRTRGIDMYGLWPPLTAEDEKGIHGKDERLNLKGFDDYTRLLLSIVLKTAGESGQKPPRLPAGYLKVPFAHQETDYTCGPAALLSVLRYWGKAPASEKNLYDPLHTTEKYGTQPAFMAETAAAFGLNASTKTAVELPALRAALKRGETVVLMVQAWRDGAEKALRWAEDDEDGHYVVLVGMDDDYAYFMDPWLGAYDYLSLADLKERWHDVDLRVPGLRYDRLALFMRAADASAVQPVLTNPVLMPMR